MALDPLTWAILLMFAGCGLAMLEVFIPSGGILGFLSATAVVAAIILAFYYEGPNTGLLFSAAAAVGMPIVIVLALKYWPHTPMGRRFLLGLPTEEETMPESHDELRELVGKVGTAKTPMLLSGAIVVDGKTYDAVSKGMPIDRDQMIKVVEVRGNRVVVRPVRETERRSLADTDDLLSRPIDELGLDPIDDPLGESS